MLSALVLALLSLTDAPRSIPELLPADTGFVLACDDVPALCAALATLPLADGLDRDERAALRAQLQRSWGELVERNVFDVEPGQLAPSTVLRAFVAMVSDDDGDGQFLIGIEGANDLLAAKPEATDGRHARATLGSWTFLSSDDAVAQRPLAVAAGTEISLAKCSRFHETNAILRADAPRVAWAWLDRDLASELMLPFFGSRRPDPNRQKTLGAMAWRADVEDGVVHSVLFNEEGSAPSVLHVDAPRAFDDAWLAYVPPHARGFATLQLPFAVGFREIGAELARDEETQEDAERVTAFADTFLQRALVIATTAQDGVDTQWEAWVELDSAKFDTQSFDAAMDAIDRILAEHFTTGRFQRDDGRIIREITRREDAPLPQSVWYSTAGSWLIATTTREHLEDMIASGEGSVPAVDDVRSNASFATALARLRLREPIIHDVSFVDPRATFEHATDALLDFVRTLRRRGELAIDESVLRSVVACLASQSPSVAVSRHVDGGIVTTREGFPLGDVSLAWCAAPGALLRVPEITSRFEAKQNADTRREGIRMDLETLQSAIERYQRENGHLPTTLNVLLDADPRNFGQPYLDSDRRCVDLWENPYVYEMLQNGAYRIASLGADGKPGGVDRDEDVQIVGQ